MYLEIYPDAHVVIERVGAMPGQGVTSMFNFGYGAGVIEGICAALFIPYFHVLPQTWKRQMGIGADKTACREMAQKLWPGAADRFKRVKDDGRADAALLGRWACLNGFPRDS
jgi:crossover junction endodeoxyribonuclease RuvC